MATASAVRRVLILDDEPEIGAVLEAYLRQESFEPVKCSTVAEAITEIEKRAPDFLVLDITLPDGSGLDVLRHSQAKRRIPALLLTARADEVDRILGLELGADDYVTKPFSPREVTARIRAILRRTAGAQNGNGRHKPTIRVRDLELDEGAHEVRVCGKRVEVTPAEFRILRILMSNVGQVLTRAHFLDLLQDEGEIFERTLDRHINHLRRKIEPDRLNPTYVITVYGVGYKLANE